MAEKDDLMEKVVSLCKQRGFVFPGSEIYGGLANTWDLGPLGVELKNNVFQAWWKFFVQSRKDMVGIDAAILMNPKVWEASGHVANFNDAQMFGSARGTAFNTFDFEEITENVVHHEFVINNKDIVEVTIVSVSLPQGVSVMIPKKVIEGEGKGIVLVTVYRE